jgi:TPR repeat protein
MTTPDPREPPRMPLPILGFVAVTLLGLLVAFALHQGRGAVPGILDSVATSKPALQRAETAFRRGDDRAAVALFTQLAAGNNPEAQYWLGHMTELGLGVPRDPAKAIELYKKAAAGDVASAQLRLGEIYMRGNVAPPDFARAMSYLRKAAYHGNPRAAMLLGQMYRLGMGTAVDARKAYAWSEVSALEGGALARRERDASLHNLDTGDQKAAIARARGILAQIKREATPPQASEST